jgi:hypothetical protein
VILPDRAPSAAELKKAHTAAIRQSYRTAAWDSVPELVKVYRLLEQDKRLSTADRADLRFKARSRLLALGDQIVNDARRERGRQRQREAAERRGYREPLVAPSSETVLTVSLPATSGRPTDYVAAAAAPQAVPGGLGEDEGEALVELIRSTIAPDTWDTAGGPGTIYYWNQWKVLVVRQTQEVHWMIGGLRGALGK